MGNWLQTYGESIYNTTGGYIRPQEWGAVTQKNGKIFVHLLKKEVSIVTLADFPFKKINKAYLLKDGTKITTSLKDKKAMIAPSKWDDNEPDEVIVLEVAN
jgi:alpha-L-fucosidase